MPPELFSMKEMPPGGEEEVEEEENSEAEDMVTDGDMEVIQSAESAISEHSADSSESQTQQPKG